MKTIISDKDYKIDDSGAYYLCPNCQDYKFYNEIRITKCPNCNTKLKNEILYIQSTYKKEKPVIKSFTEIKKRKYKDKPISYISGQAQII